MYASVARLKKLNFDSNLNPCTVICPVHILQRAMHRFSHALVENGQQRGCLLSRDDSIRDHGA